MVLVALAGISVAAVCTDLSSKEPHRQVYAGKLETSGSPGAAMVSTLTCKKYNVGSTPALGIIFPIFITPMTLGAMTRILYKLYAVQDHWKYCAWSRIQTHTFSHFEAGMLTLALQCFQKVLKEELGL